MKKTPKVIIREHEILRCSGVVGNKSPENSMSNAIREIIIWAQNRRTELPPEALAGEPFEYFSGGRNCIAVRLKVQDLDIWSFRADEPDRQVADRSWITEITIALPDGKSPIMSIRLLANSSESNLGITAASPGFIRQISNNIGIKCGAYELTDTAFWIKNEDDAHEFLDLILDHERTIPVLAISTSSLNEGPETVPFNVDQFAGFVAGLAHVCIVPKEFTWIITERLGRRLSVFDGGIRIYRVGFSDDDNPYSGYPLILGRDLERQEDASKAMAWLRNSLAHDSTRRARTNSDNTNFSSIRTAFARLAQSNLSNEGASDETQLDAAKKAIEALEKQIAESQNWVKTLEEDNDEFQKNFEATQAKLGAANFRISQLQLQIQDRGGEPDAAIPLPEDWGQFADWCDEALEGRVVLTPSARRGVKSPHYDAPSVAARCLLWLANTYRNARIDGGDHSLRDHFFEEGLKNSPCGGDSYNTRWQDKNCTVEWHIKGGGNTRDPVRCLRIYYFWDAVSQQVVIADMPGHVETSGS